MPMPSCGVHVHAWDDLFHGRHCPGDADARADGAVLARAPSPCTLRAPWADVSVDRRLVRRLRGADAGAERFQASLFAFNHSMLALFEESARSRCTTAAWGRSR